MLMHNPPHPGDVVRRQCLEPLGLGVSRNTLSMLLNGRMKVSTEMAIRLSQGLGGNLESWLQQQMQYDPWHVHQRKKHIEVRNFKAA